MGRKKLNNVETSTAETTQVETGADAEMDEKSESEACKEQIRVIISNIYDLQKLRIGIGNRLVQSFYIQQGVKPSTSPDDASEESIKTIEKIRKEYKRITDGIVDSKTQKERTVKSVIKEYSEKRGDEEALEFIRSDNDYRLVNSYMHMLEAEEESIAALDKYVRRHPMWDAFFKDVKGCGTLMSAVCIAYLDPYKARHVSCFFKYCGLDLVQDMDKDGNMVFQAVENGYRKVAQVFTEGDEDGSYVYKDLETGDIYEGEVVPSFHGRRKGDTEMQTYYTYKDGEKVLAVDENGEPLLKRGITYNPKLKTKLMGVLPGCLLKAKDPVYSAIYYDQRNRYASGDFYKGRSDKQKHMMAQRYMIKEFVRAMWITWRKLEGLEVDEPYEVAKLGNKPHKYNEYQCKVADFVEKKA